MHGYSDIDLAVVREVIENKLPILRKDLRHLGIR